MMIGLVPPRSRISLLEQAYADLDLSGGSLVSAASAPTHGAEPSEWEDLGDWLLLGERVGADRIFFVNNDPVLVFASLPDESDEREIMSMYRRAWSLARPRCLFLEVNGELRVYGLSEPPVAPDETDRSIEPLEIVQRASEVHETLSQFHRDRFDSGAAFEDGAIQRSTGQADQRLIADVQVATAALIQTGLAPRHAHALIERAILIRYLEDRGVLTDEYFYALAEEDAARSTLLGDTESLDFGPRSLFVRCLDDLELSYALFDRLARDFNGDLFVPSALERGVVTQEHLLLLSRLLRGVASAGQEKLFLWAYDFSVVPTSLVSTMYELFYHQEVDGRITSTYYTPPNLVEFVLADALRPGILHRAPVVCDPACGSGIFLVEAYRRIVRYETSRAGASLTTEQLRKLLLERISGCDIDESAIRLAAFSLYVAFLNYQSPRAIHDAGPLPRLISSGGAPAPLVVADAFSPLIGETADDDDVVGRLPWERRSFDVVIGNPPWSEPLTKGKNSGERWAKRRAAPYGDRSPSQLFLWRTLDLLAPEGVAALLVSAKVLFNTRTTSRAFRSSWLPKVHLERVVNFSQVRRQYFEQAVAPFALVRFEHAGSEPTAPLVYETARPVARGRRGAPSLARLDRRVVAQRTLEERDYLWKTYSAGNHHDDALLTRLDAGQQLADLLPDAPKSQYGYQRASLNDPSGHPPDDRWREVPSLKTFDAWGPIRDEWCEAVPERVKFAPSPELFLEPRLMVRRGVSSGFGPQARLESRPLAFRHTTYGIPLGHRAGWEAKVALGTVLSSLGRYWLFMVSGSWGTWNDEIRAEHLLRLPLRLQRDHPATAQIVEAVDALPESRAGAAGLTDDTSLVEASTLLHVIDGATADLFELTRGERDLVDDFWFSQTIAATRTIDDTEDGSRRSREAGDEILREYGEVFSRAWSSVLGDSADLDFTGYRDGRAGVVAAVFETRTPGGPPTASAFGEEHWGAVLDRYGLTLEQREAGALLDFGVLRAVSDTAIVVVKRNEKRLWRATAAREDAEATIAQALAAQRK